MYENVMTLKTAGAIVCAILLTGAMIAPLCAQMYPNRPIRFILPFAPGGGTDILGRIIAPKLTEGLGQPVVLENRPGAGGNVGLESVAKAKPDGYTIVITTSSLAIGPSLYRKLNYDPIKDLAPISLVAQTPNILFVHPSLPVNSLKELVDYARANPGKLNYSSSGTGAGPHLAGELLKNLAKIDIVHVPYKGAGPALIGLMGGEVGMQVMTHGVALPGIEAGKVKPLAVLSNKRALSMPNVPTAKEAGIDNFEVLAWFGILAPAGTSRDIINRLNAEWAKIAVMPDTTAMMQSGGGLEPLSNTPEQFLEFLKMEIARWGEVIKEAKVPRID